MQPVTAKPLYIRMHADDNVAIVANRDSLQAGNRIRGGFCGWSSRSRRATRLRSPISRKATSFAAMARSSVVPLRRSRSGSWVRESLVQMPDAPSFDNLPKPNGGAIRLPPLTGYRFEGFRNADGQVGTKNILAISTSVQCVAGTMEFALKRIKGIAAAISPCR